MILFIKQSLHNRIVETESRISFYRLRTGPVDIGVAILQLEEILVEWKMFYILRRSISIFLLYPHFSKTTFTR
jgi:hypothetical protein